MQPSASSCLLCTCALLCLVFVAGEVLAMDPIVEPITLDPICEPPEARNPALPPGNPSPSTRAMAEFLARFREHPTPGAMAFMNDRLVTLLESQITMATKISDKFILQFEHGTQQMQAGWPDKALN